MESERGLHNEYSDLASSLEALIQNKPGRDYIEWIIEDLRRGDIESAKANYRNQSDKFDSLPEIKELLLKAGIAEEINWSQYKDHEED